MTFKIMHVYVLWSISVVDPSQSNSEHFLCEFSELQKTITTIMRHTAGDLEVFSIKAYL